jgi:vacuolar-type H+-ATPase subunit I/STV1
MNPIVRNILAVIGGIIAWIATSLAIIKLGMLIIPLPEGIIPGDLESLKANMHLLQTKHFIVPFLDHSLGSVVGAFVAAKIAASRKMTFALVIGFLHLLGGIFAAFIIPAPVWFIVLDLVVAYVPAAWLGGKLGGGSKANE